MTTVAPAAEERLVYALGERFWRELHETGFVLVFDDAINATAADVDVPSHIAEHVVRQLVAQGLLWEKQHGFFDAAELARRFGEQHARDEWRADNVRRQAILRTAVSHYENPQGTWNAIDITRDGATPTLEGSFEELSAATCILQLDGYVEVQHALGGGQFLRLAPAGYDLVRDEKELRRAYPRNATEDEHAHTQVVPDVLRQVVSSCKNLLREHGWTSALDELQRGDDRYAEGNWSDAVSEYYAAVESGLRYRIHEAQATVASGAALKDLARRAAELGFIPANYQELFGFLNSIRSPRKHGQGPRPTTVEVGPAEALLMANHARALLIYLGHRP